MLALKTIIIFIRLHCLAELTENRTLIVDNALISATGTGAEQ